jgi:hypothetical protein
MASKTPTDDPWADPAENSRKAKRAAKKAEKKANKKTPWFKQIWQVYKMTAKQEPRIWIWLALILFGVIALGVIVGQFIWPRHVIYMSVLAVPLGLLGAMMFLARHAERAAYKQIEGKPGAAFAALGQIKKGWTVDQEPIAIDGRSQDMVFRAVGRPGIVLIGDGNPNRLAKMMRKEQQRAARVAPGVVITEFIVGDDDGQVPLVKLQRKMQRLKPTLTKNEVAVVTKRIQSMGGLKLPVPKGVDPMKARPDHKALRGR